jgi:molecular chaperone GrpE
MSDSKKGKKKAVKITKEADEALKDLIKEGAVKAGEEKTEERLEESREAKLSLEVEKYKKLAEENFKHYQYSRAELENLKKRMLADRNEMRKYGVIPFAKETLHVVDNLERALEHLENADKDSLTQGIKMTIAQFDKALEQFGIVKIPTKGKAFDPNVHEGFLMIESNEHEPNTVIDELQKGYILDGRLVRPAKVTVSVPPKEKGAEEGAGGEVEGIEAETEE